MTSRLLLLAALISATAGAGARVIKNDNFNGTGNIFSGLSFGEYQGAGVLFVPDAGDYPLKIVAVDVLLVPYMNQGTSIGQYEFDLWDEDGGTVTPPAFGAYHGRIDRQALALNTSSSMFNRYTFPTPIIVNGGKVFVKLSEVLDTASDGTTIALDTARPFVDDVHRLFRKRQRRAGRG